MSGGFKHVEYKKSVPETPEKFKQLHSQWVKEVCKKPKSVDKDNQEDWHSLCLGWAIGKGLTIKDAKDFASKADY